MVGKRRVHGAAFKAKVVLEALKEQRTVNELAGVYGVHPSQVNQWKRQAVEGLVEVFSNGRARAEQSQEQLQQRLYEEIGRLKVELDWLKKRLGHEC